LCQPAELERITVATIDKQALALARHADPRLQPAVPEQVRNLVIDLARRHAPTFESGFVIAEWEAIVDAQGIAAWADYRGASRTGRGKPLSVTDRKTLWHVFETLYATLAARHEATWSTLCRRAEDVLATIPSPFDAVIVDEIQDLRPAALRLIRALA